MQVAWDEYGEDAFEFCLIEAVDDPSNLVDREQYWIDKLGAFGATGLNGHPYAKAGHKHKCDEQTELPKDSMKQKTGYQYKESGLDNIYLDNGFTIHETPYGEGISIKDTLAQLPQFWVMRLLRPAEMLRVRESTASCGAKSIRKLQ